MPKPKRGRFRWPLFVGVPLAVLAFAWLLNSVRIGFTWNDLLERWGIENKRRYSAIVILALTCVAIAAIARVLRGSDEKGKQ